MSTEPMRDKQIGLRLSNRELNGLDELVGLYIRKTGQAWDRSSVLRWLVANATESNEMEANQEQDEDD